MDHYWQIAATAPTFNEAVDDFWDLLAELGFADDRGSLEYEQGIGPLRASLKSYMGCRRCGLTWEYARDKPCPGGAREG